MGLFDQTTTGPGHLPVNTEGVKADIENVIQSISSGNPNMEKIKEAAGDLLDTAASILSNHGIGQMTGSDPSAQPAGGIVEHLRDGLGLNSAALDSLRQTAEELKNK